MTDSVTTKEYWDEYWGTGQLRYPTYDKTRGPFRGYSLLLADCVAKTRARLGTRLGTDPGNRPLSCVDCGCGEGLILRFIQEQHPEIEVWGIEYSDAVDKARAMGEELGLDLHLIRGDLFEICAAGTAGPFDILISVGLIEHFEDPAGVMSQLAALVPPGGCVITVIPNFDGLFNFFWKVFDPANYRHHVPISQARLLEVHQQLGLEDVTLYTMGTPTIPGINAATAGWQKALNRVLTQINGRILQRIWPRQATLSRRYPMTSVIACVGWKPLVSR